jgi:hypothetical protein
MIKFGEYGFVNGNALRDGGDIQSTAKQKAPKIDFVFITFHPNDKNKATCVQSFIDNFKLTAEDAGTLMYPTDRIVMKIWNDSVQYQMLLDALTFSNNSMIGLSQDFINSFKG